MINYKKYDDWSSCNADDIGESGFGILLFDIFPMSKLDGEDFQSDIYYFGLLFLYQFDKYFPTNTFQTLFPFSNFYKL
ncbi:MAG: hypothetical protein K9I84_07290 [Leadbetterella sp.]|nr:hypothetical protein [Leadbetterella sp.]